jgi:hypothetical protein
MEMLLRRTNTSAKGFNLAEKECREGMQRRIQSHGIGRAKLTLAKEAKTSRIVQIG